MKLNKPLVAIGVISFLYLIVAAAKLIQWPPEVGHIATTIVAVLVVHILDHTYFRGEIRGEFEKMSSKIVSDVRRQTEQELEVLNSSVKSSVDKSRLTLENSLNKLLADQSESLEAMQTNAIRRIYPSRSAAAARIAKALSEPTQIIRLMGVSLNDYFRGDNPQLRDAWIRLSDAIQNAETGPAEQEIRVMMINPRSVGAMLRSFAESSQTGPTFVGRLKKDIEAALDNLLRLESLSADKKVRLSCKLYNVAPSMFICHADSRSFVQHYHFWTKRRDATPMAVIEYEDRPEQENVFQMHSEIRAHFDVIWENAAVPISAYWTQNYFGIEETAGQSGLVNIFNVSEEGSGRISALMKALESQPRPCNTPGISIQGISLKSFFSHGLLSERMYETIRLAQTDVRILFLDPDGEQARFRSYREYLLKPLRRQIEYHAFTDELQRESTLWVNTHAAINQLIAWIEEFRKDTSWVCRVRARKYRSAPVSFLVQIGDRMLTEPYNYGKLGGPSNVPVTLGTDMPLFEFQGEVPAMFDDVEYRKHTLNLRNPFRLVMNHFDFAFETGVEIPLLGRESSAAAGT